MEKDLLGKGCCVVFEKGGGGMCNWNFDNWKNIKKIIIIFVKRIFLDVGELMLGDSSVKMF